MEKFDFEEMERRRSEAEKEKKRNCMRVCLILSYKKLKMGIFPNGKFNI